MPDANKGQSFLSGGVQQELIKLEDLPDDIYIADESDTDGDGKPKAPEYTAARFFKKRPEDYMLCVAFLAADQGLLKIARLLKVHHKTVAAVRDHEGVEIDIQKQRIKRNIRNAIDIGSERLPDIMAQLSGAQVPISLAVLIDKLAMMEGEPTSRVEHVVKGHLTHGAVLASLESFPEAIDIETVPMVSHAGEEQQKGADDASAGTSDSTPESPAK